MVRVQRGVSPVTEADQRGTPSSPPNWVIFGNLMIANPLRPQPIDPKSRGPEETEPNGRRVKNTFKRPSCAVSSMAAAAYARSTPCSRGHWWIRQMEVDPPGIWSDVLLRDSTTGCSVGIHMRPAATASWICSSPKRAISHYRYWDGGLVSREGIPIRVTRNPINGNVTRPPPL